jgi:perosamine synthetase
VALNNKNNEKRSMLQIFQPYYDEREEKAVVEVFRSKWLGLGKKVEEFENRFAEKVGTKHAVAVNSCTAALHIAVQLLNIKPDDEVIVPTITFVSTAHVVKYLGAKPVFCDVEEDSLMLDWQFAQTKRTPKTAAIIPVLYAGQTPSPNWQFDLPVIYDAAHAAGSRWSAAGNLACWSFHAVKNLSTGDGGMITMDDTAMYERAKRLRWLGIDRSTWERTDSHRQYWWSYGISEIGWKCHMNDITAAIGLVQLSKLDEIQSRRHEIVDRYFHNLDGVIDLPKPSPTSSWHLFVVRTPVRDDLSIFLREKGINTGVHYRPIHLYDCYGETPPHLPVAEREWSKILTLPLYPGLGLDKVDYICDAIKEFFNAKGSSSGGRGMAI